ncbi:MAG: hypothetical protein ABSG92_00055 [Conexivisphaerales archaeon]|jgi:hypothetical protein
MGEEKRGEGPKSIWPLLSALALACLGTALAYFGYVLGPVSLNINELLGSAIFWYAAVFLLLTVPFREAARIFSKYIRTSFGIAVFAFYMAIHLVLYGFLFEAILASIYSAGPFVATPGFFVTTNVFLPPSLASTIFDIAYNPSIVMIAPPVFTMVLSFYNISAALIISVLVLANISKTKELGELCTARRKARTFVVLPALGIVFGASCCLSVAGLMSLTPPAAAVLASAAWIYYGTYFFFPSVAAVLLYLNLRSVERISAGLRSPQADPDSTL